MFCPECGTQTLRSVSRSGLLKCSKCFIIFAEKDDGRLEIAIASIRPMHSNEEETDPPPKRKA